MVFVAVPLSNAILSAAPALFSQTSEPPKRIPTSLATESPPPIVLKAPFPTNVEVAVPGTTKGLVMPHVIVLEEVVILMPVAVALVANVNVVAVTPLIVVVVKVPPPHVEVATSPLVSITRHGLPEDLIPSMMRFLTIVEVGAANAKIGSKRRIG